ncbi:MAG: hypothetical protein K5898_16080 [Ruminococcus sp.]|uniref:hypothetical protein n=1 Tax=Ruminococcus sp. TaxID=41978 RepID=UPI0025F9BDDC|nr:hypothetical protein [Ruminococcus sp.]MCR4796658.1 hypothetical protein [Ruminococcus sp.]
MDDLMGGIGSPDGMDDISNMNALAQQAEQEAKQAAMQAGNNAQNSYGQQSTGYSNAQNGYGQQSAGYSNAQNSYGQQSANYNSYDTRSGYPASDTVYSDFGADESKLVPILKGVLGAVIGAIPGVILIILVAKLGFIASICGAVMAVCIFFGYNLMTKNTHLDEKTGLIICACVMIFAIYFAVRTSWCLEISSYLQNEIGIKSGSLSTEQSNLLYELIGIRDVSFSEISSEFSSLLEKCDFKGEFIKTLLENIAFAALGGFGTFAKFGNMGNVKI